MRRPAEITRDSAVGIAKWRIGDLAKDPDVSMMQKFWMTSALAKGGVVEQIGNILYDLGLKLSIDQDNPEHAQWIKDGAVELDV